MSLPKILHAVPSRVKSAVKLLSERWTLLALYPGQLSARLSGTALPHCRKLVHRKMQVCINVNVAEGMTRGAADREPLYPDSHDCTI
jgi:hypothetical protein